MSLSKHTKTRGLRFESLETRRLMAFDPTASEQELMQLTNRFRTDPQHEFSRLMVSASPRQARDANVEFSLDFFNSNMVIMEQEMAALTPVAPVAWDPLSQQVAQEYLPFVIAAKSTSHTLNGTYQERINRYGFDFTQGGTARENLFANAFSPIHAHAAYVLEWGPGPDGLQGRGHRNNLMNPNVNVAGMAFTAVPYEPTTGFGPNVNAQELIGIGGKKPMATGAVYQDLNGSGWYDAGEGLAGVQITFDGPSGHFVTSGLTAGGYGVTLPAGTYTAVATGGGMRYPVSIPNVVVGARNVWLNFVYDPNAVPADTFESNNTFATATVLTGADQVLSNGTIHRGDVDYFRFPAITNGPLRAELRFANSNGNLDLRAVDAGGNLLAQSRSTGDVESVTINVVRGNDFYLVVEQSSGATGGPYTLQLTAPTAQTPSSRADTATTVLGSSSILLDVLRNDSDPDGDISGGRLTFTATGRGTAEVTSDNKILYTPPTDFAGIDKWGYTVTDAQGLSSPATTISIMVVDFLNPLPFHNSRQSVDVNGDGVISAIDALLIINEINTRGSRALPDRLSDADSLFGFVDVNANGSLEPLDALLVIDQLNSAG